MYFWVSPLCAGALRRETRLTVYPAPSVQTFTETVGNPGVRVPASIGIFCAQKGLIKPSNFYKTAAVKMYSVSFSYLKSRVSFQLLPTGCQLHLLSNLQILVAWLGLNQ